jgi:acyl-CoA synthetase (AMP-forming)/AMP-acid ligase II
MKGQRLSHIQVGEWIDIAARQVPDKPCYVFDDGSTRSFRDVQLRTHRLASALARRGVQRGDRIALLAIDSGEFMETLLAIAKVAAVSVPLNYRLREPEIENLLNTAEPTHLFVSDRYAPMAERIVSRLTSPCAIVNYDGEGELTYDGLLATGDDHFDDLAVDDEEIFAIAFTSGTTGLPKGVMQSHRMFKQMSSNTVLEYRFRRDEFRYSAAPMFHVAGMGLVINCIIRCQRMLILPQFDADRVIHWMRHGLTGVFLVPTMISTIVHTPGVEEGGFDTLKTIFYGASPMTPTLLKEAMAIWDCDFYNGFSAGTEAGQQTLLTPEDHRRAAAGDTHLLSSIGKPGYAIDLRICDDEMVDVARGEVGEIVTRSDMVMSGYLNQPERTAQAAVDGWFRGGDLAWQDEEGYLYLAGRKNDMIIRGGENIYPVEIESVIAEYPGVVDNAIVGVPDDHWGETVRAFVTVASGETLDVESLQTFCRERLAGYKVPTTVVVLDEFPRNASGKILKRELRQW